MPSETLTLFHTDGCHLCELAQAMLQELQLSFQLIDIVESQTWVGQYGERIPVLKRVDGAELGWPFDPAMVSDFVEEPR